MEAVEPPEVEELGPVVLPDVDVAAVVELEAAEEVRVALCLPELLPDPIDPALVPPPVEELPPFVFGNAEVEVLPLPASPPPQADTRSIIARIWFFEGRGEKVAKVAPKDGFAISLPAHIRSVTTCR